MAVAITVNPSPILEGMAVTIVFVAATFVAVQYVYFLFIYFSLKKKKAFRTRLFIKRLSQRLIVIDEGNRSVYFNSIQSIFGSVMLSSAEKRRHGKLYSYASKDKIVEVYELNNKIYTEKGRFVYSPLIFSILLYIALFISY